MSRSATPATRNEATRSLKPPKLTPCAELTIDTAIRPSRERLRTVARGCTRLDHVQRTHPQPPDPQSETGNKHSFGDQDKSYLRSTMCQQQKAVETSVFDTVWLGTNKHSLCDQKKYYLRNTMCQPKAVETSVFDIMRGLELINTAFATRKKYLTFAARCVNTKKPLKLEFLT